MAALIGFDPLADEVHHFLTAQHVPASEEDEPDSIKNQRIQQLPARLTRYHHRR